MKKLCLLLLAVLAASQVNAQQLQQIEKSLLKDIKASQQRLSKAEKTIAKASADLSHDLFNLEQQVISLRGKTAAKRRALDEQTIALSKIQQQLASWQQQENYQKRLLLELADTLSAEDSELEKIDEDPSAALSLVEKQLALQQQSLSPAWREKEIVYTGGEISAAQVLSLGPVNAFYSPVKNQSGLLDEENQVAQYFDSQQTKKLAALYLQGSGRFVFDITLGKASLLEQQQETVSSHLQRGGFWVMPILGFALLAFFIALFKAVQIIRLPKLLPMLNERIDAAMEGSSARNQLQSLAAQLKGAQARLLQICIDTKDQQVRDDQLLAYLLSYRNKLNRYLGAITITAAVAPLLGLLGTVSGMIETFNMMSLFGAGDPEVVSGGISKALITTELGLVVAIPALVFHALLNRAVSQHNSELNANAIHLSKVRMG